EGFGNGLDVRDRMGPKAGRTTGLVMANNLVRRLDVEESAGFAVRDHNLVETGPLSGPDDTRGVPRFLDLGGKDYRLLPGSPGVDAGDPAVAPVVDYLGLARLGPPDVGAFELGGTKLP